MTKNVIGFVLIEAPFSALNNAGTEASERTENIVRTKKFKVGRNVYPYVSGQAWRYWWRETLKKRFNWEMSPITREKKIAFTEADPVKYPDDDIFGYMRAPKGKAKETRTRASVLKNTPLISVLPIRPTEDFGVLSRHDGDPVPYEHEAYSTVFKGAFALDIDQAGIFSVMKKAGYQNIDEDFATKYKLEKKQEVYCLDKETRTKRIKETLLAIPFIHGGAMSARHLTDVTPSLIVMSLLDSGNHIFLHLARSSNGELIFDIELFKQTLKDYSESIMSDVYLGIRKGFLESQYEDIQKLNGTSIGDKKIIISSPKNSVEAFTQAVLGLV